MSLATLPQAASTAAMESVRVPSCQHTDRVRFGDPAEEDTHHVKEDGVCVEGVYVRRHGVYESCKDLLRGKRRCVVH